MRCDAWHATNYDIHNPLRIYPARGTQIAQIKCGAIAIAQQFWNILEHHTVPTDVAILKTKVQQTLYRH